MENLRRILIPWTDNGYNFHFDSSDTIHTYVVIITNVVKNSPAEEAGLRVGDGIVSINGNLLRNLTESEIYSLINNFRNTTLKLTVLQNISNNNNVNNNNNDNDKNKKVAQLSYGGQKFSHDFQKYCVPRIGSVGGSKEVPKTSKRKFSKYSRNMSDVTQNSRFYCQSLKEDTIRRSSSPLKESESSYYHITSVNLLNPYPSPNQLQLNRVGGIMRKPLDSNTKVHNNLFMTKTDKPEMRRNTKLTYLTCSPIPYRSCRVVDPIIKQERPSASEVVVQERIHKQLSIDIPEISSNGAIAEKNVPRISYICSEHDMNNIDPIAVMIMWKIKENLEVIHPVWQCCTISVDKGMFQVKENEHEFCCGTTISTSTSMENKISGVQSSMDIKEIVNTECAEQKKSGNNSNQMVYNFIYNDTNQRKWEFLLEFSDSKKSISAKWMHFFDHATQSQSQLQSQPQQEEIDEEYCKTEFINPNLTVSTSSSSFSGLSTVTVPPPVPEFPRCTGLPHTTNQPLESIIYQTTVKSESASGKGKFHTALSRVRNFTQRRLNNNDSTSEFKRQQEEWILKTEPHFVSVSETEESKEVAVSICTDHIGYLGDKVQIPHFATLPLDKWQRSVTSPLIPLIVEICVKVIEKFGMHYVGIYRVSGNKLSLDAINNELRRPLTDIDVTSDVWNDIYAMSGVLKSFLRSLPDGVFPKDYYFEIISAWKMYEKDREKRLLSVQRLLNILDSVPDHPEYRHHRETLKYLTSHLYSVSSKNALNKMTSKNLAVVFAPTLIRPPTETNEILMSDFRYRIELVESIINFHEWMFSPSLESACNIPPEVGEDISLLSDMQFESFGDDQMSADDKLPESQEDARVLIKDIIESVKNVSTDTFLSESDNTKYTLIELNPLNKEAKEKNLDSSLKNSIESSSRLSEEYSIDTSPETSETLSTKEKKSSKRMSFKLSKLRPGKSSFPREQLLLTNKKLCALSIALISSTRHPLNSTVIMENDPPKITVE